MIIEFKYKDKYTRNKWSLQQCSLSGVEECVKFYGLGVDCEYQLISIQLDNGETYYNTISSEEAAEDIKKKIYEIYRLDWMLRHGYSLSDIFNVFKDNYIYACLEGIIDGGTPVEDDIDFLHSQFEEKGFDGEIFACYDEFLDYEFQDSEYIKGILNNKSLYYNYLFIRFNYIKEDGYVRN